MLSCVSQSKEKYVHLVKIPNPCVMSLPPPSVRLGCVGEEAEVSAQKKLDGEIAIMPMRRLLRGGGAETWSMGVGVVLSFFVEE